MGLVRQGGLCPGQWRTVTNLRTAGQWHLQGEEKWVTWGRGCRRLCIPSTLGGASGPVPSAVLTEVGANNTQRMGEDKARPARRTWGGGASSSPSWLRHLSHSPPLNPHGHLLGCRDSTCPLEGSGRAGHQRPPSRRVANITAARPPEPDAQGGGVASTAPAEGQAT